MYDWFLSKGCYVSFESTYDYDMVVDDNKLDTKTKRTNIPPRPDYMCSISAFNTKQKCDGYVFLRIKEDLKIAWILGYEGKKPFFRKAVFKNRGEKDANEWRFKDDCYNLEISKLKQFILKNKN